MKALVLCGGIPQIALIQELKQKGIETILLDMNEKVVARDYADKFYPVSVLDVEAVKKVAIEEKADIVTTVCADQVLLVVAQISEELGLPCYIDYKTAKNVSDKSFMKKIFVDNSIPTSKYIVSEKYEETLTEGMEYPMIVKPVDSYSSRGVKKVTNELELKEAFNNAIGISRTKTAIVEEFVEGIELSVDVYVEDGKANVLCISRLDKIKGLNGFVINRCSCPAPISEQVKKIVENISQDIATAFKLYNAPMLIQMITDGKRASVLEFCARTGGGDKFRLIKKMSGFDVVKAVVDLTLGEKPHVEKASKENNYVLDEFLYCDEGILEKIDGFEDMKEKGIISEYYQLKSKGTLLNAPSSSSDRVAYFTIQADSIDKLMEKHKAVDKNIKVLDVNGRDLLRHDIIEGLYQEVVE